MAQKSAQKLSTGQEIEWQVASLGQEAQPWDRMQGESMLWYIRFEHYRLLGPKRSVGATWHDFMAREGVDVGTRRRPPRPWWENSRVWNWQERAEAWDMAELARLRREFAEEAKADKSERIRLLKAYRGKLIQALPQVDIKSAKFADLSAGIRMVVDQLRSEYDDQPTQRLDISEEEADAAIWRGLAELAARKESPILIDDPDRTE